jgi:hypothetical protein
VSSYYGQSPICYQIHRVFIAGKWNRYICGFVIGSSSFKTRQSAVSDSVHRFGLVTD